MGSRLVKLCIAECRKLANPSLIAIVKHCSLLEKLDIRGTGITAPAVMKHVIKPNQLEKLRYFMVDIDTLKALRDLMESEESGTNQRWQEVLLEGEF